MSAEGFSTSRTMTFAEKLLGHFIIYTSYFGVRLCHDCEQLDLWTLVRPFTAFIHNCNTLWKLMLALKDHHSCPFFNMWSNLLLIAYNPDNALWKAAWTDCHVKVLHIAPLKAVPPCDFLWKILFNIGETKEKFPYPRCLLCYSCEGRFTSKARFSNPMLPSHCPLSRVSMKTSCAFHNTPWLIRAMHIQNTVCTSQYHLFSSILDSFFVKQSTKKFFTYFRAAWSF